MKTAVEEETFEYLKRIRRKLHQYPEPSFQEFKTSEIISEELKRLSIWHKKGIGKTGIIARLDSPYENAPTIALRADMDALPIEEKTGLPFSSRHPGYMHACGHDGHMAILLGAAKLLRDSGPGGNVVFIFQPAEEGGGGARVMIEAGAVDDVDMIFGGHIDMHFPMDTIAIRHYMDSSYTDSLEIRIVGKGGHAARPHETVDAVVVGSLFVTSLQTIISRTIDPLNPAVISIGSFHAGRAYNAIADDAVLRGTIRTTEKKTREMIIKRIKQTASSFSSLYGAEIYVSVQEGYPPVINHPVAYRIARDAAKAVVGEDNFLRVEQPSMGGEDFSYYLLEVPGCFVRFGAQRGPHRSAPAHSCQFDFDEGVLLTGTLFYTEIVKRATAFLRENSASLQEK